MISIMPCHSMADLEKSLYSLTKYNNGFFKSSGQKDFILTSKQFDCVLADERLERKAKFSPLFVLLEPLLAQCTKVFQFHSEMHLGTRGNPSIGGLTSYFLMDDYGVLAFFRHKDTKNPDLERVFLRDKNLALPVFEKKEVLPPIGSDLPNIESFLGDVDVHRTDAAKIISSKVLKGRSLHVTHFEINGHLAVCFKAFTKDDGSLYGAGDSLYLSYRIKSNSVRDGIHQSLIGRVYSYKLL